MAVLLGDALLKPENVKDLMAAGLRARKEGDRLAARSAFERAARLDARNVWSNLELAYELEALHCFGEAEAAFRHVLELDARNFGAL